MPKVSKQTAAKGGLMTAILGMIANVVGIGIFFKNKTVFRLTDSNAIGVIVAWAISTLIVLAMAISFGEIASCKTKSGKAGVGPWAEKFCGHRLGRYSKLGYALIFWPINTFAVMFFAGEALLNCFAPLTSGGWNAVSGYDFGRGTSAYIFLIGAVLFIIFALANYFRFKAMGKVSKGISFIKFAPIAMVVFIGIICGALSGGGLWKDANTNAVAAEAISNAKSSFSFIGVISCIPAILFSFEGYVAIDSFKNDLSNPDKQIPLGVVVGVIVIAVLYFAVTIGCITAGTGDVYQLMAKIFGEGGKYANETAYKALTMIISIFIFICLIGCVNGMSRGGITSYQELCAEGDLVKGKALVAKKPGDPRFAGLVSFSIIMAIWWVILFIPSVIWNTDAIADGSSTSMIVSLYVVYGALVLCAFINRFKKTVEVKKTKIFPVAAVIGIIACVFMIGYVGFYQFTYAPIHNGLNNLNGNYTEKAGWGMFVSSSCKGYHDMTNGEIMAFFWAMTIFASLSPVLSDLLIKGFDKKNKTPLMWEKANKQMVLK